MPRHIQVRATKPRIQYIADDSRCEFVYPFAVFTESSLEIYLNSTRQTTGFVVNGIGQSDGGSVLFSTPPALGVVVTLRRRLVVERTSDFQESGQFRAKILNDELDYLTAAIQQVEADAERSIHLEPSDTEATLTLPSATARAGKVIVFDEKGNVTTKPVNGLTSQPATLNLDAIGEGASNKHFTHLEKAKLSAIEEQAQANPRPITTDEKSTAAETSIRGFSPRDVKDMVALHAPIAGSVASVHGRTGDVAAQAGDYSAAQIADAAEKVIMTAAERAKLADVEASAQVNSVASVHGRAGDVAAQAGDYSAAQITDTAEKVIMTAAERETLARLADAATPSTPGSDDVANQSSVAGANVSDALDALYTLATQDSAWQNPVLDVLAEPPASPQNGARYLVIGSPTGAWAGHGDHIATWEDGSWTFLTPRPGWTLIVLGASAEYRFGPSGWSAIGGSTGAIAYNQVGKIDSGRLLGRVAAGQGNAQQVVVSHGLQLTPDGDLQLSGATAGPTVKGFYGRDTTGAYGFKDILPSDLKGVNAARLLGNPTTVAGAAASEIAVGYGLTMTTTPVPAVRLSGVAGAPTQRQFYRSTSAGGFGFDDIVASDVKNVGPGRLLGNATASAGTAGEIPIGIGSASSIPTLSDADGRYLRKSFADSAATVASVAADDVIALNDTSAAGAAVRAPLSALPFVQVAQRGLANGVGSLDANGRQPITEAADGAAEETALVVTSASYTLARRCIIARAGCDEIQLTSASGTYKNVYISNEKTSGAVIIRAATGQTINGQSTYSLAAGRSVVLIVIGDSGQTAWRAETGGPSLISPVASAAGQPVIIANRGANAYQLVASGNHRHVCFRYAFWTTQRSAVNGLRLALPGWYQALYCVPAAPLTLSAQTVGTGRTATPGTAINGAAVFTARDVGCTITVTSGAGSATITSVDASTGVASIDITAEFTGTAIAAWGWRINVPTSSLGTNIIERDIPVNIFPRASIEYGGQSARVYWNGARARALEPGATLISDPVGLRIPANTQFWVRMDPATLNSGEKYWSSSAGVSGFGEGFVVTNAQARVDDADLFTPAGGRPRSRRSSP
jgi:Protein of unknown function (DUF2793)